MDTDLTKTVPRSPNEEMAGIVSLARTTDKARAFLAGTLGEYDYDCPHDRPLFAFLGTNGQEFATTVANLKSDAAIAAWAGDRLADKTPAAIAAFNEERRNWRPDEHSRGYFDRLRAQVAPDRPEIATWFDLLDLDEKRPVTAARR
jgi:hypothetical protein